MKDASQEPSAGVASIALFILFLLQVPTIIVILASLSTTSYLTVPPQGLTLDWFYKVLSDPSYMSAFKLSFLLAITSTIIALVLGTLAAYALSKSWLPFSGLITSLLMTPLIFPSVVVGVALLQFFSVTGLRGSLFTLIVSHAVITVPYVIRTALASLARFDGSLEDAARTLGSSRLDAFFRIVVPTITPGLVAGGLFALITSLDNVPVTIFLLSADQVTLPVKIFTAVDQGVDPSVAAASTILIIITGLTLVAAERWTGFHRYV